MLRSRLPNYLRSYRKRSYLSQDEIAILLGGKDGAKVSRYENFSREPNLRTAIAYEVIFRAPARDLFAGTYQEVERDVLRKAQLLARKIPAVNPDAPTLRKLQALKAISGSESGPKNV